jgi:hypothetical protein
MAGFRSPPPPPGRLAPDPHAWVVSDNRQAIEVPASPGPSAGGAGCRRRSTTRCRPPHARHGARPVPLEPAHGSPDDVPPPIGLRPEPLRSGAGDSAPHGASPSISAGGRTSPAGIRRHAAPHRQFRRALRRPAAAVPAGSSERPAGSGPPPGRAAPGCDGRSVRGRAACRRSPTPRGARVSDMRRQVSWAGPLGWPPGRCSL